MEKITKFVLDKSKFIKTLSLYALRVRNSDLARFRTEFKNYVLDIPRVKCIINDAESTSTKLLVLRETIDQSLTGISEADKKKITEVEKLEVVPCKVELGYENFTADEVIKQLLPAGIEIVSAFESVGHIAHLNLRDHLEPYKYIIAEVILSKNSHIKTVVNKTTSIESKFREFPMELLAGEDNMMATVKEHNFTFVFDYSKVYWNSRLETEHSRIVSKIQEGEIVCDMFAGVGPFAVPIAAKKCYIHANDLNPNSYKYLCENAKKNKVTQYLKCYNQDGREFIKDMVSKGINIDHVIMNLPASAVEFLDVFVGLYTSFPSLKLPTIHCYCFSKAEDPLKDSVELAQKYLGINDLKAEEVFLVRDVSPKKYMICVSFKLPESVARHSDEPPLKIQKTSEN